MESADSRRAAGSDRQYVEIELDRPTLALVVDNLQHFADHYDDWGFIDKAAVHVTLSDLEYIAGKLRSFADSTRDIVRVHLDYGDWCKYTDSIYHAKYVAWDGYSGGVLETSLNDRRGSGIGMS